MEYLITELFDLEYIINIRNFEHIQEAISKATNTAILTIDFTGKPISKHNGVTPFCAYTRSIPQLNQQCELCDSVAGLQATRNQKPFVYRCHMGLVDFAVPIVIANQYCGAVMCGQFTMEKTADYLQLPQPFVSELSELVSEEQQKKLEELRKDIPQITAKQLNHVTEMIDCILKYIIEEAYIKVKMNEEFVSQSSDKKSIDVDSFCPLPLHPTASDDDEMDPEPINILLRPAIQYIKRHFTESIKIDEMAALCNISPSYFSRLFNANLHMSVSDYINRLRIRLARKLLTTTRKTVNEISFESGFSGSGYFIKLFKQYNHGLTPSQYRNAEKKREQDHP